MSSSLLCVQKISITHCKNCQSTKNYNMFDKSAEIYDLIYSSKDYKMESETLHSIIQSYRPNCKTVLDAACGTAEHHKFLMDKYELSGIDLNGRFIEIARSKNPKGQYHLGDMTNFDLAERYDLIVCLFSSIGYVKTFDKLVATLCCFKKHLNEDGLIIIEPWISPDKWVSGIVHMQTYDSDRLKICRMAYTSLENEWSVLDFEYLVGGPDGIEKFQERHELGLFDQETMERSFKVNGLKYEYIEGGLMGRGLYLGINTYDS